MPAFGTARLLVLFRPPAPSRAASPAAAAAHANAHAKPASDKNGGGAADPNTDAAAAPGELSFDYAVHVDVSGAAGPRSLRFSARGRGLPPRLLAEPRLLHFGAVAAGAWGDRLVSLTNACAELPLRVEAGRGGAYFSAATRALTLAPGASAEVAVRYAPRALGRHEADVAFSAFSAFSAKRSGGGGGGGAALATVAVTAVGGCEHAAGKAATLPGGVDATPATFARPR